MSADKRGTLAVIQQFLNNQVSAAASQRRQSWRPTCTTAKAMALPSAVLLPLPNSSRMTRELLRSYCCTAECRSVLVPAGCVAKNGSGLEHLHHESALAQHNFVACAYTSEHSVDHRQPDTASTWLHMVCKLCGALYLAELHGTNAPMWARMTGGGRVRKSQRST